MVALIRKRTTNMGRLRSLLFNCKEDTTLDTAIICGLISAASAIIVSVITAVYNNKLIVYRLEQLEKKMDGNAELTKRVVVLETKVEALENDGK